ADDTTVTADPLVDATAAANNGSSNSATAWGGDGGGEFKANLLIYPYPDKGYEDSSTIIGNAGSAMATAGSTSAGTGAIASAHAIGGSGGSGGGGLWVTLFDPRLPGEHAQYVIQRVFEPGGYSGGDASATAHASAVGDDSQMPVTANSEAVA